MRLTTRLRHRLSETWLAVQSLRSFHEDGFTVDSITPMAKDGGQIGRCQILSSPMAEDRRD